MPSERHKGTIKEQKMFNKVQNTKNPVTNQRAAIEALRHSWAKTSIQKRAACDWVYYEPKLIGVDRIALEFLSPATLVAHLDDGNGKVNAYTLHMPMD